MQVDWTAAGVLGSLSIALTGFAWRGFTRALDQLRAEMVANKEQMTREHDAVKRQIADIADTGARVFVQKREFDLGLRGLSEQLGGIGKQVERIDERVDHLYSDRRKT